VPTPTLDHVATAAAAAKAASAAAAADEVELMKHDADCSAKTERDLGPSAYNRKVRMTYAPRRCNTASKRLSQFLRIRSNNVHRNPGPIDLCRRTSLDCQPA